MKIEASPVLSAKEPSYNVGVTQTWVQSLGWKGPGGGHGNPLQYSCLELK